MKGQIQIPIEYVITGEKKSIEKSIKRIQRAEKKYLGEIHTRIIKTTHPPEFCVMRIEP
jgi:hypothetical protein